MTDDNDITTDGPVLALDLIEVSVIMPDGSVASLWWRSDQAIPPGYRVALAEPQSSFGPQELELVRQH